jgi:hypothetical protein
LFWILLITNGLAWQTVHAQDDVSWLLAQINNLRAGLGLPPYTLNAQLSAAATQQSQYLAQTCNIAHVWPDGSSPGSRAAAQGYAGDHVIENIYAGSIATAADAWNFWTTSPVHYSGLVNTLVTEIGIGIAHGGLCGHAFTLVFGRAGGSASVVVSGNPGAPAAAVPPAPAPYVPPPPSSTPTATIPTLTPSATWTLTPTHTPSPTFTAISPTATPLVLPTVPIQGAGTAVAEALSPSPTTAEITPSATQESPSVTPVPPIPTPVTVQRSRDDGGGIALRDLIPLALIGQIVLIGIAGFVYFRKAR